VQLYRYFVSQSIEFCRHNPLCCFSTSVYCKSYTSLSTQSGNLWIHPRIWFTVNDQDGFHPIYLWCLQTTALSLEMRSPGLTACGVAFRRAMLPPSSGCCETPKFRDGTNRSRAVKLKRFLLPIFELFEIRHFLWGLQWWTFFVFNLSTKKKILVTSWPYATCMTVQQWPADGAVHRSYHHPCNSVTVGHKFMTPPSRLEQLGKPKVLSEHRAIKTYWGRGGTAPRVLSLGTGWRWMDNFTPSPF
jgi:hypothetical protein